MGEQLKDGLGQAWTLIATFVPKFIGFLIVLLIGWLIAKAISKGLKLILKKLGFGKLMDKTGMSNMLRQSNVDPLDIIVKLVYYFILLIALQLAFGVFGPSNPVSQLLNDVIAFLPRIVVALVLIIVAAAIAKVVRDMITSALSTRPAGRLLGNVAYWLIMAFGIIAALGQINIATTVTTPVLITILATIGGVIVVGFGGGLIKPARQRWEGWLENLQGQFTPAGKHQAATTDVQSGHTRASGTQPGGSGGGPSATPGTTPGTTSPEDL